MNKEKIVEMNRLNLSQSDISGFAVVTNKQYNCFRPVERPQVLKAFDISDKLKDLEAEVACEVLDQLITHFPEVQEFLVENYIDLLTEED